MKTIQAAINLGVLALFAVILLPDAFGQAGRSAGLDRVLTTGDGWPIHITYYESSKGKEAPVVILLPGADGEKSMTRKAWDSVAKVLQKRDFAVVTADLRKHGDSMPPTDGKPNPRLARVSPQDYALMVTQDLEAIKAFLVEEHQKEKLNIRKLGIGASGSSAIVAAAFAANDWLKKPWNDAPVAAAKTPRGQDVRAILMLSPAVSAGRISSMAPMKVVADETKGVAIHVYYNSADKAEKSAAEKLFRLVEIRGAEDKPESPRYKLEVPAAEQYSGDALLDGKLADGRPLKPQMEQLVTDFFEKFVKQRTDPWKTRTSRLQ